jgi:hypothetical protein
MSRASKLLAVTTAAGIASSLWLFFDNRSLRSELADRPEPVVVTEATGEQAEPTKRMTGGFFKAMPALRSAEPAPQLPEAKDESRMERRARRTDEFAARFGRLDGETDDEYRARIMPLLSAALIGPRMRAAEMRRAAEEKAKVTPAQSAELDKAFDKVYEDVLDYTNKAITDGQLSPYERNVAGWLDYAGGLGGILTTANGQIGKILDASQVKAMYESGFEWGEYLGLNAPWEKLTPPPPAPK